MVTSFLPAGYQAPTGGGSGSGKYLRLKDGTTKIRVLSPSPALGWEYWNTSGKPVRLRDKPLRDPVDIRLDDSGKAEKVKHFWAMAVWDYESEEIKILQVTQATVQNGISILCQDEDWGHPTGYDLKITKTGKSLETKYSVVAANKGPISKAIREKWEANPVNLDALFEGADPFTTPVAATDPAIALGFKSTEHKSACWEKYGQLLVNAAESGLDVSNFEDLDDNLTSEALTAKANALKALIASQNIDF